MAPLPPKLRHQPPSAFGAVGRAALASGAGSGHEVQHRAYLQLLQERNQAQRQLRQEDEQRQSQQVRREQGFSVCFSGANSSRRTPSSSSYGSRLRDGHGGGAACGFGRGDVGGSGDAWGGGAWRKWEERTVEIKGDGGEIYAVRPTGERRDVPATVAAAIKNPRRQSLQDPAEKLNATLGTTQKELKGLCQELLRVSCDEDQSSSGTQVAPFGDAAAEGSHCEESTSSCDLPCASDLAERITRLPRSWRSRLLGLLEEAEADVALAAAAGAKPEALRLTTRSVECLQADPADPCDPEVVPGITTAPPSPAANDPVVGATSEVQAVAAASRELRTTRLLAAAEEAAAARDDAAALGDELRTTTLIAAAEAITSEDGRDFSVRKAGAGVEHEVAGTETAAPDDAGDKPESKGVSSPRSPASAGPVA